MDPAASAAEALAALRRHRPDVLVCDIGMPGEDGYALLSRVRALAAEEGGLVPAVALTAYARADDRRRALAAGYQVHLAKPVDPGRAHRGHRAHGRRPRPARPRVSVPPLSIAFVTSEMTPFMKTGGLADVSAALPRALARLGHQVTVFLPRYARIPFPPGRVRGVGARARRLHLRAAPASTAATLEEGLEVVFIEHPPFFERPNPYGPSATKTTATTTCASRSWPAPPSNTCAAAGSARTSSTVTTGRRASCPST